MTRKRRPFEVFPEELEGSTPESDHARAIVELATMVDALASQHLNSEPSVTVSPKHHVVGPAGGQFDFSAGLAAAPTRRTLTWFSACCNPCFLKPNRTTTQDGCPPFPPVSVFPNC